MVCAGRRRHHDVGGLRYAACRRLSACCPPGSQEVIDIPAPVAHVIVDVPSRQVDAPFDYAIPDGLPGVEVGACVLVEFGNRPVVGYVVGLASSSAYARLKPVIEVLDDAVFPAHAVKTASWIAGEYVAPLSECLRLFLPPGGTPRAVRVETAEGSRWELRRAGVGPVDDRWVSLASGAKRFVPRANATTQRAVLDALADGPVRVAELAADLGSVDGAIRALAAAGAVTVQHRRRMRDHGVAERPAPRHERLTDGQTEALAAIQAAGPGDVILLDGVTGSGKTEVYLRAIEDCREAGGRACVLVPEISLTPQTVGRFRSRFADDVAVLHSRLSPGERYDQWDLVRRGLASVVVGARSALFAPIEQLRLIIIDEEHEGSYKQGSSPRYHARDVAARLARECGAVLVLGSASPSMESIARCEEGGWLRVKLPDRVHGRPLPPVTIVDMAAEFAAGHRSMFSRALTRRLEATCEAGEKAVLLLNRRGFASFLLCRECGHVPECQACSVSLTYHEVGSTLKCHHCGIKRPAPAVCPQCGSVYLRKFGAGTQRVQSELQSLLPDWPVVRMDADTTRAKGAHERLLAQFESLETGVLLGTQMIAKGLDYPDVTLVGVISADVSLNLPDFRAPERTFQMLEQVAGRAGRGVHPGHVVVQTYWPEHPAIMAAATHDPAAFYDAEKTSRKELGYPPFGRLANVLVWGASESGVVAAATATAHALSEVAGASFTILGPSPAPLARARGVWRWHILVKAPPGSHFQPLMETALASVRPGDGVHIAVDVDPIDLL